MPPKTTVDINAGAVIVVDIEGSQYRYNCSGANTKSKATARQVTKKINDCITASIAQAKKLHSKKKKKK